MKHSTCKDKTRCPKCKCPVFKHHGAVEGGCEGCGQNCLLTQAEVKELLAKENK